MKIQLDDGIIVKWISNPCLLFLASTSTSAFVFVFILFVVSFVSRTEINRNIPESPNLSSLRRTAGLLSVILRVFLVIGHFDADHDYVIFQVLGDRFNKTN
jgi:hypothetical protein